MKPLYSIIAVSLILMFSETIGNSAIRVLSVRGKAVYKTGSRWKPVRKNLRLREGVKISTGFRSYVVLRINNARVKIRQMSMIKINRRLARKGSSRTNIGLRYGRINARIKRVGRVRTVFKISTPVATSSVRGTEEEVSNGPQSGMIVDVIRGEVGMKSRNGINNVLRKGMRFQLKPGNPRPQPLLARRHRRSFTGIHPDNLTSDERSMLYLFGDEMIGNSEDPTSGISPNLNANVNMHIIFP